MVRLFACSLNTKTDVLGSCACSSIARGSGGFRSTLPALRAFTDCLPHRDLGGENASLWPGSR
ncbi:hypothetical protein CSC78_13740 [Pseudoxanthomonas japonensis]|uniref:Uncharacterized protein n=1 Tax=Pseudoxanthomonas japonensis TaxID=69284 RepID=A0ABQ6ZET5_9GAMM|nr:hypothetical protein CSC78_13740 [Pseudoxanthomonas japonensis]